MHSVAGHCYISLPLGICNSCTESNFYLFLYPTNLLKTGPCYSWAGVLSAILTVAVAVAGTRGSTESALSAWSGPKWATEHGAIGSGQSAPGVRRGAVLPQEYYEPTNGSVS